MRSEKKDMSLREKNGKWTWDFYPNGSKGKRVRKTLPGTIKTRGQAEKFISNLRKNIGAFSEITKDKSGEMFWLPLSRVQALFNNALDKLRGVTTEKNIRDFKNCSRNLLRFIADNNIPYFAIVNPTPDLFLKYISYRETAASKNTINKELYAYKKFHEAFVHLGIANPLDFEVSRLYLKESEERKFFSEKFFEALIEKHPKLFLGEDLVFIETPANIERLIPDALFSSKDGNYVVVEIQKGRLDRNHSYKLLEYRDKIEARLSTSEHPVSARMMVVIIGDDCPIERKMFLDKYKIELKLLPIREIENKILSLL